MLQLIGILVVLTLEGIQKLRIVVNESMELIDYLEEIYRANLVDYLASRGWPKAAITKVQKYITIEISTLECNEGKSRIGIHKDPPSPFPALVAGSGVHQLKNNEWNKMYNGGRLFSAEGWFDLSYTPLDVTIMNGNNPHGVTTLRALSGEGSTKGRPEMKRNSIIIFSKFLREPMKHFGNYNDTWNKKKWQAEIDDLY